MRSVRGDFTVEAARQYLARFRFWGDDPLRVVSGFSGGERSRLALAKLLLEPRNLLFLDEPTNHLDIPAAEILEEALIGFEGTVILVSHDRRFLESTTTRIVAFATARSTSTRAGFATTRRPTLGSGGSASATRDRSRERRGDSDRSGAKVGAPGQARGRGFGSRKEASLRRAEEPRPRPREGRRSESRSSRR
jgi:ATP-binding cassette subfamily F protein 3